VGKVQHKIWEDFPPPHPKHILPDLDNIDNRKVFQGENFLLEQRISPEKALRIFSRIALKAFSVEFKANF